jgi:hypothetical protein
MALRYAERLYTAVWETIPAGAAALILSSYAIRHGTAVSSVLSSHIIILLR